MILLVLFVLIPIFLLVVWLVYRVSYLQLLEKPVPSAWEEILQRNVALYRYLPDDFKQQLHGYINVFLYRKYFEGCGGLKITDKVKVTVAAQACILLLNKKPRFYPKFSSIFVYPIKQEAVDLVGGHNVVLHEFAHQLDQEHGQADGGT